MRHRISGQRLNKSAAHRNSMRRSLMKDVIQYERIQTTEAKARAVRGEIERIITIAKRGRVTGDAVRLVHARRLVISRIGDQALAKKVFDDIAPRYVNRAGGYTRMLKLEARRGDAAKQVLLELVEEEQPVGMGRYRALLAYDGTDFCGYQRQAAGRSVQGR